MADEPAPQGDTQNPQVNMVMAKRVMSLFGQIDEAMNELQVPARDRPQVMQNLMEAIAADLMARLGAKMSEEERSELMGMAEGMDMKNPDLQSVAGFFKGKFTQEELMEDLEVSMTGVIREFIEEMGK